MRFQNRKVRLPIVLGILSMLVFALSACSKAAPTVAPAQAGAPQSQLDVALKRGKLIVGTGSTNPPWHFQDEKGNLQGFDIEMARILAKGLFGKEDAVEFVVEKPDARIPNLQAGKVDIIIQFMTVTAQRAQLVDFTIPYYREAVNTLLPKNSPYTGAKDMVGKKVKVATLQNVYSEEYVHQAVPDAEVLQFDSQANAILAIDSGRADAAMVDDSTARWYFAQSPDKYKVGNFAWYQNTYAAAVRPNDQRWLNFVNTVFHESMTGVEWPAYSAAYKKYFGQDLAGPASGFPEEFGVRTQK
jgi:polar amino acid transport system substrate-binding protein